MRVFHIRTPNRLKRAPISRTSGAHTICGAPATEHDARASWEAFAIGDFVPCEHCIAARDAARKGRKRAAVS